jgi:hypothetical protein
MKNLDTERVRYKRKDIKNFHSSHRNVKMIKSRKIMCVGHAASMRYDIFVGKRPHFGDSIPVARINRRTVSCVAACDSVDWLQEDKDENRWWAFDNTVMNLRASIQVYSFLTG